MSSLGLVIAIAVPIMGILAIFVMVGRKQQSAARQKGIARAVRENLNGLIEAFEFLLKTDTHKEMHQVILERVRQLNVRYEASLPKKGDATAQPVDLAELEEKMSSGGKKKRIFKSDREIRYAKRQVSRVLKTFPSMVKNKSLSESSMLEYRRYLKISLLEMEVDSFVAQGDVAAQRGDVTTASSYYKAARKQLVDFNMQYPEKNDRIRELGKKTSALFNGDGENSGGSLAKELSKEKEEGGKDEHGFPTDPGSDEKQKF